MVTICPQWRLWALALWPLRGSNEPGTAAAKGCINLAIKVTNKVLKTTFFPLVTAKLPCYVKLQFGFIEWFVLIELIAFASSPQLCPSQGLKGMRGLVFQRCLPGMKERKQWLFTEYPKQHSSNLNANQVIIHLKSRFIWKSYFCLCIMHVLKLNSQSTQLKTKGLFFTTVLYKITFSSLWHIETQLNCFLNALKSYQITRRYSILLITQLCARRAEPQHSFLSVCLENILSSPAVFIS